MQERIDRPLDQDAAFHFESAGMATMTIGGEGGVPRLITAIYRWVDPRAELTLYTSRDIMPGETDDTLNPDLNELAARYLEEKRQFELRPQEDQEALLRMSFSHPRRRQKRIVRNGRVRTVTVESQAPFPFETFLGQRILEGNFHLFNRLTDELGKS